MSYSGYTRFKKLKKLYYNSKFLIDHHGMNYFWRVVKYELGKQGFSIFKPDERPLEIFQEPTFEENYRTYFKNLNNKLHHEHLEFSSNSLQSNVHLSIIVIIDPLDPDSVRFTLDSISKQVYKNYDIILVSYSDQKITQTLLDELSKEVF